MVFCTLWTTDALTASRGSGARTASSDTTVPIRQASNSQHVRTTTTTNTNTRGKTVRAATKPLIRNEKSRNATSTSNINTRSKKNTKNSSARAAVVARIATNETRTGAEYEQCKTAYFTCMDQFCQLKNDEYRRCSCSERVTSLEAAKQDLTQASEQLTAFNENLDIVGKTAAQAAAMNTESDGEKALTKDNSASKALLTAIMNTIRGTDGRVEHSKFSDLNSLDLSFDTANSFGTSDVGQTIASYNGVALYSAVYPQCRNAVKNNCNDASLQRAVNAYLMAIEQDCNTVQTAITNKQKATHAAIRESSSMLDMARAENHKNMNSDDIATCLANVESAILAEDVCGKNYHKCLDNGEYIDVSTGAPIAGVVDFYKLGTLLTFNSGRNNNDQKLAQNPNNKTFVTAFEKRVKQFAEPALDKCYDNADKVWADYLNKAMLDIYYAQQSKVNEIKQGCFDFVSACYMNGSDAMTNAMRGLVAEQTTTLNPDVFTLNRSLCSDYIASCNNMFDGQIIANYINNRHDTDSLTACRAVVKQCFDNYGGTNYENFYYPSSGLFSTGHAPDWFSLYEIDGQGNKKLKSECAKQLASIEACSDENMIIATFGGFDYYPDNSTIFFQYGLQEDGYNRIQSRLLRPTGVATEVYNQIIDILQTQCTNLNGKFMNIQNLGLDGYKQSYNNESFCESTFNDPDSRYNYFYETYSVGKRIVSDTISIFEFAPIVGGGATSYTSAAAIYTNPGSSNTAQVTQSINTHGRSTKIKNENLCPRDYQNNTDTQSWGACLCWENGGRRSNDGTSTRCTETFPVEALTVYNNLTATSNNSGGYMCSAQQTEVHGLNYKCTQEFVTYFEHSSANYNCSKQTGNFELWPVEYNNIPTSEDWCTAETNKDNMVCPFGASSNNGECNKCPNDWVITPHYCSINNQTYTLGTNTEYCCPPDPDTATVYAVFEDNSVTCLGCTNNISYKCKPIASSQHPSCSVSNQQNYPTPFAVPAVNLYNCVNPNECSPKLNVN